MTRLSRLLAAGLTAAFLSTAALAQAPEPEASLRDLSEEAAADAADLERAQAHAGPAVDRVRFLRPIQSYEVLAEDAVLVWETNTKAWLVDLRPSAACRDLDRSWWVSIETMSDTINVRNSYVVGDHNLRCKVVGLREVDVRAMRSAERAGS